MDFEHRHQRMSIPFDGSTHQLSENAEAYKNQRTLALKSQGSKFRSLQAPDGVASVMPLTHRR